LPATILAGQILTSVRLWTASSGKLSSYEVWACTSELGTPG
jgi:hypothetical protein